MVTLKNRKTIFARKHLKIYLKTFSRMIVRKKYGEGKGALMM